MNYIAGMERKNNITKNILKNDEFIYIKCACLKLLCRDYVNNISSKRCLKQKIKKHREYRKLFYNGINGMFDSEFTKNILFQIDKRLKDEKDETI